MYIKHPLRLYANCYPSDQFFLRPSQLQQKHGASRSASGVCSALVPKIMIHSQKICGFDCKNWGNCMEFCNQHKFHQIEI